jgi:hypothetical protein
VAGLFTNQIIMTNLEIFKTKQEFNKWLKELTETETLLIMEMMDEARELGYDKGVKDVKDGYIK